MKKRMILLSLILLLLLAVPVMADDGVGIEVVNETGKELIVELEIRSFGEKQILTRAVEKGGTVRLDKSETAHKEGALVPSWDILFNKKCQYKIVSKDGECTVLIGSSSCALPSRLGPREIKFIVTK